MINLAFTTKNFLITKLQLIDARGYVCTPQTFFSMKPHMIQLIIVDYFQNVRLKMYIKKYLTTCNHDAWIVL